MIPQFCPVLGILLVRGQGRPTDHSPTLDRLLPHKGYVKGNVRVISARANRIKNDSTADELAAVLRYMRANLRRRTP